MTAASDGQGKETIFLVDDDECVRSLLTEMLGKIGYRVMTADDGQQAIDRYRESYKEIDLVLMDVVMPVLSGIEAQYAMHTINPYAKVLLMSGYPLESLPELKSPRFIQKPIEPEVLNATVRAFLDDK
jgi:two-component system, cell cycle sensor histidine kinase and response regulator CckA